MHMIRKVALLLAAVAGVSTGAVGQQQAAAQQARPQALAQRELSPVQRRRVSLKDALQLAAQQGPDVAAARAQAAIVHASVEKAWTAWQPDLTATGTFDHTSAPQTLNFADFAAALGLPPPPRSETLDIVSANSRYGTLQISQPLLTPQGIFLPGIAGAASEAAARGADEQREQILLAVARAYLQLQALDGVL